MSIKEFIKKAIEQDERNIFENYNGNLSMFPEPLQELYKKYNPVDVEISMGGNAVKFYPLKELETLQHDYDLKKPSYVFATCNGDPIFVNGDKIFTYCHGIPNPNSEFMAATLEDFFSLID